MSVKNRFVLLDNQLGGVGKAKQRRPYWRRAHAMFTSCTPRWRHESWPGTGSGVRS